MAPNNLQIPIGTVFGRWTVISPGVSNGNGRSYLCRCSCGNESWVRGTILNKGKSKSCGCLSVETLRSSPLPLGFTSGDLTIISDRVITEGVPSYLCKCACGAVKYIKEVRLRSASAKAASCGKCHLQAPDAPSKKNVRLYWVWAAMLQRCNNPKNPSYRWYGAKGVTVCPDWEEYASFKSWALSSGYEQGLTIDRVDSSGEYGPLNCRWVSPEINSSRTGKLILYDGKEHTSSEWNSLLGFPPRTVDKRLKYGWPLEDVFNRPTRGQHNGARYVDSSPVS